MPPLRPALVRAALAHRTTLREVPVMEDPRRRRFRPYLADLMATLALRDWTIHLKDVAPADEDALASIDATYGRKRASLRLSDEFLDSDPDQQRHTLAHELIHLHLAPAWGVAEDGLDQSAMTAFRRMAEYAVDGLADALAPLLPPPPSPTDAPAADDEADD